MPCKHFYKLSKWTAVGHNLYDIPDNQGIGRCVYCTLIRIQNLDDVIGKVF